jgi:excinuclease ABC subunit C
MPNTVKYHQENIQKILKNIPHTPGVYQYLDENDQIIYVGKAVNLFNRVRQYFRKNDLSDKTKILVQQITDIKVIKTVSEFDAFLLEAKLINLHKPKYNILAKDDKSPIYIQLTLSENLPHVFLTRKRILDREIIDGKDSVFGPFQSAKIAREMLRYLRKIVPYCTEKRRNGKPCFYTQIGLCRPCPSEITAITDPDIKRYQTSVYRRNILRLKQILSGNSYPVIRELHREMTEKADIGDFESAARIRDQIGYLNSLLKKRFDPMLYMSNSTYIGNVLNEESKELRKILDVFYPDITEIHRIECFDISDISGKKAAGSMVTTIDGIPDNGLYRKFRLIRKGINDFAMMAEIITRRLRHPEWKYPDLIVVDGGKGQVSAAKNALSDSHINIPVIGLAKRMEDIVIPYRNSFKIIRLPLNSKSLQLLQRIRDEAHRFAVSYYRKISGI